jgi:hypothetical protein
MWRVVRASVRECVQVQGPYPKKLWADPYPPYILKGPQTDHYYKGPLNRLFPL